MFRVGEIMEEVGTFADDTVYFKDSLFSRVTSQEAAEGLYNGCRFEGNNSIKGAADTAIFLNFAKDFEVDQEFVGDDHKYTTNINE